MQQRSVAAADKAAGFSDQPHYMPTLARALPHGAYQRSVVGEDEIEGKIACRCSGFQCIMQPEGLGVARSLIGSRETSVFGRVVVAARRPLQVGSSGKPQNADRIVGDAERCNAATWHVAHAQAQSGSAMCNDGVTFGLGHDLD